MAKGKDTFQDTLNEIKEKKLRENVKKFRGSLRVALKELGNKKVDFEMCLNHIEYSTRILIEDVTNLRKKQA